RRRHRGFRRGGRRGRAWALERHGGAGVRAVGRLAGRRLVRVRLQASARRQGCEPANPRPWRTDGPVGRLHRRGAGRSSPGGSARGAGGPGARPPGVVGHGPMHLSVAPSERATQAERRVTILGATGSIGASTADVIKNADGRYRVEAVASGGNAALLAHRARELGARFAAIADAGAYRDLKAALVGTDIEAAAGPAAVVEAAGRPADLVMAAISGAHGLAPTLAALQQGHTV